MSAENGTAPAPASSGFSLWALARIVGIAVGVATLLRLASIGFNVEYNDLFKAFQDRMAAFFELGGIIDFIEEWIVHPTLHFLRDLNLPIPPLQDHWRQVFALTWLLLAAVARNYPGNIVGQLLWAAVCALVTAVAVGTQPFNSTAVLWWPSAGVIFFMAGLLPPTARRDGRRTWLIIPGAALSAAPFFDIAPITKVLGYPVENPALLGLVIVVGGTGLLFAALGFLRGRSVPATAMGLDILWVMGLALGIGYLMMK